tara:strand:+ start:95 stop:973 length:879 start_codon:yes stop_codon:yes gene_type:complete
MEKIFFIINVSNQKKLNKIILKINSFFKAHKITYFIFQSEYKGHAIKLTKKAIDEKATSVVACGGDGTVNEIGSLLIGTNIKLGIIPLGSGNGIARHFKIPFKLNNCLNIIALNKHELIDVGKVNSRYFIGNMGLGFESEFIKQYNAINKHGIYYYFIAFIKGLYHFKFSKFEISFDNKKIIVKPFMMLVSNLNQQGYNFTVTPNASCNDGYLNFALFQMTSLMKTMKFLIFLILRIKNTSIIRHLIKKIKIKNLSFNKYYLQLDGEKIFVDEPEIVISIIKKRLKIIIPKN